MIKAKPLTYDPETQTVRGLYPVSPGGEPYGGVYICEHSWMGGWPIPNDPAHPACLRTLVGRCAFCREVRVFVYCEPGRRMFVEGK